ALELQHALVEDADAQHVDEELAKLRVGELGRRAGEAPVGGEDALERRHRGWSRRADDTEGSFPAWSSLSIWSGTPSVAWNALPRRRACSPRSSSAAAPGSGLPSRRR